MTYRRLVQGEPGHLDEFLGAHDRRSVGQVRGVDSGELSSVWVDEVEDSKADPCQLLSIDGQASLFAELSARRRARTLVTFDESAGWGIELLAC